MQLFLLCLSLTLTISVAFSPSRLAITAISSTRRNDIIGKSTGELMKENVAPQKDDIKEAFKKNSTYTVGVDAQGYEVKARDWFNGLSSDPGDSLNDPRAIPPPTKAFAEKVKSGAQVTFKETIALIDEYFVYFEVPFSCGDLKSKPNENTGSAKIFSFALLTQMDEKATLGLFGEIARDLSPSGTDHANIRNFIKSGWRGVTFPTGLAIASKLSTYDDTDSAMKTQSIIAGADSWDPMSDSWMP